MSTHILQLFSPVNKRNNDDISFILLTHENKDYFEK